MSLLKNNIPDTITIGQEPDARLSSFIRNLAPSAIAVIVDGNTGRDCYPLCRNLLDDHELISIPPGEKHKDLDTCSKIWKALTDARLDRKALVINLGGGVIGDMGGFCAATYKRGIRFVNLPTSLLSQVDASVGGKLGIDFMGYKNHLGVFTEPEHVFVYSAFLRTLPAEELRSGFAEVIKHHLIADATGWQVLRRKSWEEQNWQEIIPHSVKIKSEVVGKDPRESGLRKVLNLGHTVGHAMESYFLGGDRPILHGEGVAAGMICENYIAELQGLLKRETRKEIETYIFSQFGKLPVNMGNIESITRLVLQDKKNVGSSIRAALLENIGKVVWDREIRPEEIHQALNYYADVQI